jgi:hypothetical protein
MSYRYLPTAEPNPWETITQRRAHLGGEHRNQFQAPLVQLRHPQSLNYPPMWPGNQRPGFRPGRLTWGRMDVDERGQPDAWNRPGNFRW